MSSALAGRFLAGALSAAESYPTSEVRDSGPECQAVTAQERPGGATPCPRSGAAARRSYPASEVSGSWEETPYVRDQGRPGEATSHPRQAKGGDPEEPPRAQGQGPPTPEARAEKQWLSRHSRA